MRRLQERLSQFFWIDPRSIWRRYVIALCLMLSVYTGGHLWSMSVTFSVNSDAAIGALVYRQEALSQRIFVTSHRLLAGQDERPIRKELGTLIDAFEAAHERILDGDGNDALKPENSSRLRPIFYNDGLEGGSLNGIVRQFVREARLIEIANLEDAAFTRDRINLLRDLGLFDRLEAATEAFNLDSEDRGKRLYMVQLMLLVAGILLIGCEAFLIFWPSHIATKNAMQRLEDKSDELSATNDRFKESLEVADQARREADESNSAKSMFLANMSHELRTPLNAIIGFSSMIKAEVFGSVGNARYKEYASDIERSGTHLLDLIGDLMDISQVEVGAAQLEPRTFKVAEMMADVSAIAKGWPMARRRCVEFSIKGDQGTFFGDPVRLRQIVLNLLSNAVKFTQGDAKILVTSQSMENGGLQIMVEDTGCGFELEQIQTLTQPFRRGDNALTRNREGSGLGLSLVSSFVEMHGGSVVFSNAKTGGARVVVTLPPPEMLEGAPQTVAA